MRVAMFEWLLLPFILWGMFQGVLMYHAVQVETALSSAIFEGQLEASVQGRYTPEIYTEMRDYLVQVHRYDPTQIEITGTESLRVRGEYLDIEIKVPKPGLTVIPMLRPDGDRGYFTINKRIMSEYIP